MSLGERLRRSVRSYLALPVWVQVWVGLVLVPVNLAAFAFLDTALGRWAALATALVLGVNGFLMLANGGLSKVLAIPHLLFWGPLQGYLLARLLSPTLTDGERNFALTLFVVNAVSLAFDVYDTWRWARGERDVAGFPGEPVRF